MLIDWSDWDKYDRTWGFFDDAFSNPESHDAFACSRRQCPTPEAPDPDKAIEVIMDELENEFERDIPSQAIGKLVMDRLEKMDEVAFVRFASVYRRFKDVNQFLNAVEGLIKKG